MSSILEAVEWSYKLMKWSRKSKNFRQKLKLREASIGMLHISTDLLRNIKKCMGHWVKLGKVSILLHRDFYGICI